MWGTKARYKNCLHRRSKYSRERDELNRQISETKESLDHLKRVLSRLNDRSYYVDKKITETDDELRYIEQVLGI